MNSSLVLHDHAVLWKNSFLQIFQILNFGWPMHTLIIHFICASGKFTPVLACSLLIMSTSCSSPRFHFFSTLAAWQDLHSNGFADISCQRDKEHSQAGSPQCV
jgi:hypothetical protein